MASSDVQEAAKRILKKADSGECFLGKDDDTGAHGKSSEQVLDTQGGDKECEATPPIVKMANLRSPASATTRFESPNQFAALSPAEDVEATPGKKRSRNQRKRDAQQKLLAVDPANETLSHADWEVFEEFELQVLNAIAAAKPGSEPLFRKAAKLLIDNRRTWSTRWPHWEHVSLTCLVPLSCCRNCSTSS